MINNIKLLRVLLLVFPVMLWAWIGAPPPTRGYGDARTLEMTHSGEARALTMTRSGDSRTLMPHRSGDARTPPDKKDLRCFTITFQFPFFDKQGNKFPGEIWPTTGNRVFLCKDLVMYELPYGFASGRDGMEPDTSEIRYKYFVYHRDSARGVEYDLHYPGVVKHRFVDSVRLTSGGLKRGDKGLDDRNAFPLLYTKRDAAGGNLMEAHSLSDSAQAVAGDTVFLYFSDRYGMLPSRILVKHDSLPQMRLVRMYARIDCKDVPAQNGIVLDHAELNWKIEETPFFNRDSAMIFMNKYQVYCDSARGAAKGAGR